MQSFGVLFNLTCFQGSCCTKYEISLFICACVHTCAYTHTQRCGDVLACMCTYMGVRDCPLLQKLIFLQRFITGQNVKICDFQWLATNGPSVLTSPNSRIRTNEEE